MSDSERTVPADQPYPAPQRGRALLLIVDDDPDTREIYSRFLRFQGFDVQTAVTGTDAMRLAGRMLPDLIVMDLALPHVSGWTAIRKIKASPATRHIPIVVCTAHRFDQAADRAREAGCDLYLTKPCAPETLAAAVARLLTTSSGP